MAMGFDAAFVIIRFDKHILRTSSIDVHREEFCSSAISVIRVYWSLDRAKCEAARLNELNRSKDVFYSVQHTRVESIRGGDEPK